MNHVVIIGFMGSGKTRVGKQLSKDLGLSFVDLERLITRKMNMSAREIFQRFGSLVQYVEYHLGNAKFHQALVCYNQSFFPTMVISNTM